MFPASSSSSSTRLDPQTYLPLLNTSNLYTLDDEDDGDMQTPTATTTRGATNGSTAPPYTDEAYGSRYDDKLDSKRFHDTEGFSRTGTLRSTVQSRETEFDLDDDSVSSAGSDSTILPSRSPLLVGLLGNSSRYSQDFALHSNGSIGGRGSADRASEEGGQVGEDWKERGGNMLSGIANMANSILGAGIIGLPYAIREAGFLTGIFLLVTLCLVTDWTIRLIVLNAKLSGRNSYIEIMGHCFGKYGRAGVSFFQLAFAYGGMCAFGVIIGDTIPRVLAFIFPFLKTIPVLSLLLNRQFVIFLATVGVSFPLSLHRDISKLSKASGIALVGMLIIVCSVLIEGSRVDDKLRGSDDARWTIIKPRVFEAIGVISFAFVCHHNSLMIFGSLQAPTLVTHISTAASLIACLVMSLSGFLVFTDKTQANILNNFPHDDLLINIARLCFGLNMFTTLPLEAFVCREVIEGYFFDDEFNKKRHIIVTTAIVFSSMAISMMTCDLGVVLELTGGLSATVLAFVFPAICFLKLSDAPSMSRTKFPAWVCAAFGLLVMVLSAGLSLYRAFWGEPRTGGTCGFE
ncbi:amino acid transporter [Phaffia rhodozyma]|uniref:Amino acid transporter n=1 Tax=Phaffia rhodozyma TaxID=264483 RepID=A0A0F7SYK0_PHARH|nr:amino acid transporter [Phaffia rhodozyma]